jgi:molybdate transport system ATP-binding protein
MHEGGLRVRLRQRGPIALDAELVCARGELLALVGPSGSGKSTILRAIAGLLHISEGNITCDGETWFEASRRIHLDPRQRRIGIVFQHYALFPHLSALENVMEALLELPMPRRRSKAKDWLDRLHLHELEDRKPAQLSGGQQQRVAVARALAREPLALLLDEPFSAVDSSTREKLYEELAELRRDFSMPVVLVTHDLDEALILADRMSILSQGRTLQTGLPFEVMTRPDTVHVAQLVGQKNIFRAGVIEHVPERGVTVIEWRRRRLDARLQTKFAPGSQVAWTIPRSHVVVHTPDRLSENDLANRVPGKVSEFVRLGENAALTIHIDDPTRPPLFVSVPLHLAQRYSIASGSEIVVSFLAEGIHLMPPDKALRRDGSIRPPEAD